jgi:ADP-ribose pyrophosphatase YjhB (NUDIX family)
MQNSEILFTLKKSGPYKGLWGLPGGAIEFGETPEEALKRELLEETALAAVQLDLLSIATTIGEYNNHGELYQFHHIGIIYKVSSITLMPGLVPEEEGRWVGLKNIEQEELTPFARHVLKESFNLIVEE